MAKPWIHSLSSAKIWKGKPEDYLEIHNLLDSSKGIIADSRHRALTHTSWFLSNILEKIFGSTIVNTDGRVVSVRDIGERHILEDFGMRFIPTPQDYLESIPFSDWMFAGKGEPPPSSKLLEIHRQSQKLQKRKEKYMSAAEQFVDYQSKIAEMRKNLSDVREAAWKEMTDKLFQENPTLVSFRWNQYTPYFNDGDPCYFSARTDQCLVRCIDDGIDEDDDVQYDGNVWDIDSTKTDLTTNEKAILAVSKFLDNFSSEDLEELFGDHVEITVTKDGTQVDDYNHD